MNLFICRLFFLLFFALTCFSQNKYVVQNKKGIDKVDFQLINNIIIIPVEVNGVSLSFLLDTGVSRPIVFNFIKDSDSLEILNAKKIYLKGLGNNGLVEALTSSNNQFKIGDAINNNQDFFVVFDSSINFAPKLGIPIHGIIGYDFFKDLIVDINYKNKYLKIKNPGVYREKVCRKCEVFDLEFINDKPYFNIEVKVNKENIPVKLLIDSGSSDSLWLFENDSLGLNTSDKYFEDFLGFGLSGSVHGKRSKIDGVKLKSFQLNKPKVAFPDSLTVEKLKKINGRNGSAGGEILKRFNITFDYRNAKVILKKNSNYNDTFSYNKSGIELEHDGVRLVTESYSDFMPVDNSGSNTIVVKAVYVAKEKLVIKPAYSISQIRKNSPAEKAGLKVGDVVIAINNKDSKHYSLQELIEHFFDDEGRRIKLKVERDGRFIEVVFILESLLK